MKKLFIYVLFLLIFPLILCMGFHLIHPEIPLGRGEDLKSHYMNKEILLEIHGLYKSIDVEEYVLGVLPSVIPPDYEEEALKVQAILIRTNVLKEMEEKNTKDGADLSYEYLSEEDREQLWGKHNYNKWEQKLERVINSTAGKVIKEEGNLIMAAYHEVSIGKTASAEEILEEDISYLKSVESSHDVEAKNYMNLITYTYTEIKELLKEYESKGDAEVSDTENMEESENDDNDKVTVSIEESTENGFVKKASVNGHIYSGEEMGSIFDLPSDNFYVEEVEDGIRFVCLGKGSCLGLSQYGANYMAHEGKSMEDIINHYYQGVSIEKVAGN